MRKQLSSINRQIEELQLIKSRVEHRLSQIERSIDICDRGDLVSIGEVEHQYILTQEVPAPHTLEMISIVTKECFVRAAKEHLPISFKVASLSPTKIFYMGDTSKLLMPFFRLKRAIMLKGSSNFYPDVVSILTILATIFRLEHRINGF